MTTAIPHDYQTRLSILRRYKDRAALLCRCHAEYMMQAEREFTAWRHDLSGGPEHDRIWSRYLRATRKASRMFARHNALMRRILGGER